jgi:hypothetical protein
MLKRYVFRPLALMIGAWAFRKVTQRLQLSRVRSRRRYS